MSRFGFLISILVCLTQWLSVTPSAAVDFNRDVQPILSEHCYKCHGPDASARKAKLRFDTKAGAFSARGDDGPAIIPGDSAKSPLYQ
ncbi:MAG: c-type cytochrome domain-containing protein, partial [Limisphaerales bacterium]